MKRSHPRATSDNSRKRLKRNDADESGLETLNIGAATQDDEEIRTGLVTTVQSGNSSWSIRVTNHGVPPMTTLAARVFADEFLTMYNDESMTQILREQLQDIPDHYLPRVWNLLVDRYPTYLSSTFIVLVS